VAWGRLTELVPATIAAASAGKVAEATLDVVSTILLVLPWVGSMLLLIMFVHWPAKALLTRWRSTHFPLRRS
jgi:hypothetical protein